MKYFELLGCNSEPTIIKGKNEIIKTLTENISISEKTAGDWLDRFTNLMGEMSTYNPAFTSSCPYRANISEKMEYICRKMAQFILSEKYVTLIYDPTLRERRINCSDYYYEIPLLFMPILISFINEIRKKREKKKDVTLFFKNIDKSLRNYYCLEDVLRSYSCKNIESLMDTYNDWMVNYLGKNYFIHFEELLNECSETQQQEAVLKKAVGKLSDMSVPNARYIKMSEKQNMVKLDQLLIAYKTELIKEMKKNGLNSLYEMQQPFYTDGEKDFINEVCGQFYNTMKKLLLKIKNFINQEHNAGSQYIIAIKNLESLNIFEQKSIKFINNTELKIRKRIRNYYIRFEQPTGDEDKFLLDAYNFKKLSFNKKNNDYKIEKIPCIFQDSLNNITNSIKEFYQDIRDASGNNASKFSAKRTEEHFKTIWIIDEINSVLKHTIEIVNKENFQKNFPSLYRHEPYVYYIDYLFSLPSNSTGNG